MPSWGWGLWGLRGSPPTRAASGEPPSDPGRRAADLLATSLGRGAGVVDIGGVVECGASPKVGSEEIRRPRPWPPPLRPQVSPATDLYRSRFFAPIAETGPA